MAIVFESLVCIFQGVILLFGMMRMSLHLFSYFICAISLISRLTTQIVIKPIPCQALKDYLFEEIC